LINENSSKKKVVIVISSGDKQVIMPALNMALKSKRDNLYEDVKVQFLALVKRLQLKILMCKSLSVNWLRRALVPWHVATSVTI